jgi:DNA-binding winged helix-turn-helix (wHTH) protein/TolB-like protein
VPNSWEPPGTALAAYVPRGPAGSEFERGATGARKQWIKSALFAKIALMGTDVPTPSLPDQKMWELGQFRLDPERRILWRDGKVVPLGPKVVHTLVVLVENNGQVVSREELLEKVWDGAAVEENGLTHNISVLRKALKTDPTAGATIETVPRRGYRFCHTLQKAQVSQIGVRESAPLAAALAKLNRHRIRGLTPVLTATALLCLGVVSAVVVGYRLSARASQRHSVAVIGFVNLSHQSESAWLSPALAEMMTTELGVGGKLLTIPDESVARARTELNLPEEDGFSIETLARLGRDLHADVVVSGAYTVLPAGPEITNASLTSARRQVRLDLRVQNTSTGELVDTVKEVGEQSSLFEMVTRAGARVRKDLGVAISAPDEIKQARASVSSNPEALRLYSEGVERLRSFDALGARSRLEQAIQVDPNYALAHSALSDALSVLGYERPTQDEA